ncbi:MAG TPA: hydrogenase maturation nickel metallochaperone HypA [Solirubrobacteraceae bacterium]|nr:hydrogenase maturation nickel metallochaperone HypA [Solirubrobacteraceae bacterium]
MHELSVASAVVNTAVKHADGRPVSVVSMRVGRLRQVVPDSLQFYFEIVARDTVCEDATLELTEIEARARCSDCGLEWELLDPVFRCPACRATAVTIVAGEELAVDYIEVEEQEAQCTGPR